MEDFRVVYCRDFLKGNCKRQRCRFYHPKIVTIDIQKERDRQLGYCFCGAKLRSTMNHKGKDDDPIFYVVCSRTSRSMRRCY